MQKAIKDAYAKGFLGKNIFGSGYDLDIYWHGGAGAYEVGAVSYTHLDVYKRQWSLFSLFVSHFTPVSR